VPERGRELARQNPLFAGLEHFLVSRTQRSK
jgi:hypothetical protein